MDLRGFPLGSLLWVLVPHGEPMTANCWSDQGEPQAQTQSGFYLCRHQRGKPGQAVAPSSTRSAALFASGVPDTVTDRVCRRLFGRSSWSEIYKLSDDEHVQKRDQGGMQCQLEGGARPPRVMRPFQKL